MNRYTLLFLCINFLFSDGIVETGSFYSGSLDGNRNYTIYLPEGYHESNTEYPVIYFLHGFGGTNNSYNAFHSSLNDLISNGSIMEMIVVSADGSTDLYQGSFYTNSILNGDYEDYIAYDLVDYIDESFRTLSIKEFRALSGHSMGAYGAFRLGLNHSDIFNSFAAHSGPIHLEGLNNPFLINAILIESFFGPLEPDNGSFSMMMFGLSSAFSPNLDNPPWYVDLPMDSSGNVNWDVFEMWQAHDPYLLVENHVNTLSTQNIYFDCGNQDELQLAPHSEDMHNKLSDLGVSHTYAPYSGTHSGSIYSKLEDSFQFHSNYFSSIDFGLPGDVNEDGLLNILDVVLVIGYIIGNNDFSEEEIISSDINEDGIINVLDVVLLVNSVLGSLGSD